MSRIVIDVFSYISHFVCFYNFNYTGSCGPGIIGILRDCNIKNSHLITQVILSFNTFLTSFSLVESPPCDLQIIANIALLMHGVVYA